MQIHTRKLRNTFSIWQTVCSHEKSTIQFKLLSTQRAHVSYKLLHEFRSFPTGIKMIRKSDTPSPSIPSFLLDEERDKLEACLHVVPLHGRVSRPVYETTSALYPARVQELSCKSISEGCFRAGDSQLVKRLLPTLPILSAGTPRVPRDPVERFKLPG